MTWLVTGGAGYIGSHVVRALVAADLPAVVVDDLSTGRRDFVPAGVPVVEGSILDGALLERALADHAVRGVIHVAGFKYAGVSVDRPLHTYAQNVEGTRVLLAAMAAGGVDRIVFSSSAAVYGTPDVDLVTEQTPKAPESPYGESKLIGEWLLRDQEVAAGLRHTSLRYFNVVGSAADGAHDVSPHNLFPKVFEALREGRTPTINGIDYPTPDGTNVRDYLHVVDLAAAHVAAARRLDAGQPLEPAYNLGSGDGSSVRQIMTAIARVTGIPFEPGAGPRRTGDPARIVASGDLAARDLGWAMTHTLDEMVASAWAAPTLSIPLGGPPSLSRTHASVGTREGRNADGRDGECDAECDESSRPSEDRAGRAVALARIGRVGAMSAPHCEQSDRDDNTSARGDQPGPRDTLRSHAPPSTVQLVRVKQNWLVLAGDQHPCVSYRSTEAPSKRGVPRTPKMPGIVELRRLNALQVEQASTR